MLENYKNHEFTISILRTPSPQILNKYKLELQISQIFANNSKNQNQTYK